MPNELNPYPVHHISNFLASDERIKPIREGSICLWIDKTNKVTTIGQVLQVPVIPENTFNVWDYYKVRDVTTEGTDETTGQQRVRTKVATEYLLELDKKIIASIPRGPNDLFIRPQPSDIHHDLFGREIEIGDAVFVANGTVDMMAMVTGFTATATTVITMYFMLGQDNFHKPSQLMVDAITEAGGNVAPDTVAVKNWLYGRVIKAKAGALVKLTNDDYDREKANLNLVEKYFWLSTFHSELGGQPSRLQTYDWYQIKDLILYSDTTSHRNNDYSTTIHDVNLSYKGTQASVKFETVERQQNGQTIYLYV